jgi:BirA family biotin operon repressor/biotin-[acetyl-CoA-carboxylase] ligase
MNQAGELELKRLRESLRTSAIGHTIDAHGSVESTMLYAHKMAADPAVLSGAIVVAEEQRAGKGRHGRSWTAPYAQAILTSIVLRPPLAVAPSQIPMATGLAVADALRTVAGQLGDAVHLKWPNDVLLGYGAHAGKVAGILIETAYTGGTPAYFILGIGINVNQCIDDLPADVGRMVRPVSLRSYCGFQVDRTELLIELCRQLAAYFDPIRPPARLLERWRGRLSTLGHRVAVYQQPASVAADLVGLAVDVAPSGDLLVRDDGGRLHRFAAADVSVRFADGASQ